MIQLTLLNVQAAVQPAPDGSRLLVLQDPQSGITVVVPFEEESAKTVGGQLASGVAIASEISELAKLPGMVVPDQNGGLG